MSPSMNPKLIISTYIDSLVNQIDVYTEEALKKYNEEDIVVHLNEEKNIEYNLIQIESNRNNQHVEEEDDFESIENISKLYSKTMWERISKAGCTFDYESNLRGGYFQQQQSINVNEYLNEKRDEMIDVLRKAEEQAHNLCDENVKNELKDEKSSDAETIKEKLFSLVFRDKYYFILSKKLEKNKAKTFNELDSGLYLVEIDFYMTKFERDILGLRLKSCLNFLINQIEDYIIDLYSRKIFEKEHLFVEYVVKFLNDLMKQSQRVKPVIRIDRERLLSLENMTFKDSTYKSIDINLDYCKNSLEYMKYDFLKLKTFIIEIEELRYVTETTTDSEIDEDMDMRNQRYFEKCKTNRLDFDDRNRRRKSEMADRSTRMLGFKLSKLLLLSGLENLIIKDKSYTCKLSKTTFTGLANLRRAYLHGCSLAMLDSNDFSQLSNLHVLDLSDCKKCSNLNLDVLNHLKWLILKRFDDFPSSNQRNKNFFMLEIHLKSLKPNMEVVRNFKHDKIVSLKIEFNQWDLGSDWLCGFSALKILDLRSTGLKLNDTKIFTGLGSLISLNISHNGIDLIDEDAFIGLDNLQTLDMSNNKLKHFIHKLNDAQMLRGLRNLTHLNINHNEIESIEDNAFLGLNSLQTLDLSNNKLTRIDPRVFSQEAPSGLMQNGAKIIIGLGSLTDLNISHNKIDSIHQDAFSGLDNLRILDMSNNQLKRLVPKVFSHVPFLNSLNVSSNELMIERGTFCYLMHLKKLEIRENKLGNKIGKNFFSELVDLEVLDLSSNGIENIEEKMFANLLKLERLILNNNNIISISMRNTFEYIIELKQNCNSYDSNIKEMYKEQFEIMYKNNLCLD